jgi:hypothetical protein
VIDAGIEAERVDDKAALVGTAGDPDRAASPDLFAAAL